MAGGSIFLNGAEQLSTTAPGPGYAGAHRVLGIEAAEEVGHPGHC
ncbi:hypothetical protein [Mycobacterium sp. 852002-40037_SCH5390672]|nr:hypothetical protein [Mycobacterium sp. 852002-40037_SCH5390672]